MHYFIKMYRKQFKKLSSPKGVKMSGFQSKRLTPIMDFLSFSMALQSFRFWPLFQFLNHIHSWYDPLDGESARCKAATYTQHKHRINAHKHPCLECDSKPRSQCSSGRRLFKPQTARQLLSASIWTQAVQFQTFKSATAITG
jgi:hypothetical protein